MDQCGKPSILGAGPLTFHCIEPWKRWLVGYDGEVSDLTLEQQIVGKAAEAPRIPLRYQIELV